MCIPVVNLSRDPNSKAGDLSEEPTEDGKLDHLLGEVEPSKPKSAKESGHPVRQAESKKTPPPKAAAKAAPAEGRSSDSLVDDLLRSTKKS